MRYGEVVSETDGIPVAFTSSIQSVVVIYTVYRVRWPTIYSTTGKGKYLWKFSGTNHRYKVKKYNTLNKDILDTVHRLLHILTVGFSTVFTYWFSLRDVTGRCPSTKSRKNCRIRLAIWQFVFMNHEVQRICSTCLVPTSISVRSRLLECMIFAKELRRLSAIFSRTSLKILWLEHFPWLHIAERTSSLLILPKTSFLKRQL